MDELLAQFLIEGPELVQQASDALLALERRPDDRALLDDAFRAVHTLKGSVGLFDLPAMAAVLHAAEDVLSAVREGRTAIGSATIDRLLAALVQTERWIAVLARGGAPPADSAAVGRELMGLLTQGPPTTGDPGPAAGPASEATPDWAEPLRDGLALDGELVAVRYAPDPGAYFSGEDPLALAASAPGLVRLRLGLAPAADEAAPYDPFTCRLVIDGLYTADIDAVRAAFRFAPGQTVMAILPRRSATALEPADAADATAPDAGLKVLRVDAARIDALAHLVDELAGLRASVSALAAALGPGVRGGDPAVLAARSSTLSAALDRLVGQLHHSVTHLRLTPVAPLLRRFPRVVREMARGLGKEVDLLVEASGVEADKAVLEGLFEPLTHLLRNAVDHGVEDVETRRALGKPAKATLVLEAREAQGRLHLTLADDGRGLDLDAVRATAVRRGLMDAQQVAALDEGQAAELIFLPGFSTARAVTALSGRGVGMDAVRAAVQRLGGRIRVSSQRGAGTTVELVLPLAVTLTKVMVVSEAGERFGLPMDRVVETLRAPKGRIASIRAGYAFNWRDRTTPLVRLAALVGARRDGPDSAEAFDGKPVLIVRAGDGVVGLAVDAIVDRVDLPMRALDGLLGALPGVAGAATLGDGEILMILDPEALIA